MTWAGAGAPEMPPEWMGHIHTAKLDEELKAVKADGGTIVKPTQDIPGVDRFAIVLDPPKGEVPPLRTRHAGCSATSGSNGSRQCGLVQAAYG